MSDVLRLPRTLADQLLRIATHDEQQRGIGRVYKDGDGNYFCAEPGNPRNVERSDELFALFTVHDDIIERPDSSIVSTIKKETILFTISLGTKGVLELRAWICENGSTLALELEIIDP